MGCTSSRYCLRAADRTLRWRISAIIRASRRTVEEIPTATMTTTAADTAAA